MTFDQWWYDYKIKHGLKDSREVVAMTAWQAALATQRAEPLPPQMLEALEITREAVAAQVESDALALLREARDWMMVDDNTLEAEIDLMKRIDAVLDRAETYHKPSTYETCSACKGAGRFNPIDLCYTCAGTGKVRSKPQS